MAKDIQVKIGTVVDDSPVKGFESRLERLKREKLELKLEADTTELKETEKRIESLKTFIDTANKGNTPIHVDDEEIKKAEAELKSLEDNLINLQIKVADDELKKAKAEEEDLNGSAQFDVDVNNLTAIEAVEGLKSGIDGIISSAGEAGSAIQEMIDVSASFEQNKSFLEMNIGAEKAASAMDDISKIVADAPGDDLALNSILVASKSKEASLNYQDMSKIAYTAADYMQGMAMLGKNAVEAQQDMRSYIIAGNTAEIERSPILQDHIDKLKAATTPMERQKALAEALKEEGYDGIANQDTMINKQAEFEGALERSKMKLGDMFMPIEAFGMDLFMGLNDATAGVFGALATGVAGLSGPLLNTGLSLAQFGASIKTITGAETVFEGLTGMISGAGSSLLSLATGPVGIAIAAIVALGIAVYEVGKYFGWWKDVGSMFDAIKTGVMSLWDAFMSNEYVVEIINLIKQGLTDAWNAIVGFGEAIMTALGGGAGEFDILSFAIQGLQTVLSVVGPFVILIIQGLIQHFRNLYNLGVAVWPGISQAISTAMSIVGAVVAGGMAAFNGLIGIWNTAKSTVQGLASTISSAMSTAAGAWNGFKQSVADTVNYINGKIDELKNKVNGAGDWVKGQLGMGGIEGTLVTGFNTAGAGAGAVGGNVFNITINGNIDSEARVNQLKEDFAAIVNGEITENETVIG